MHLANIAFQGGTHGNFLRFCLDKYSTLTEDIDQLPFVKSGTSHNTDIKYSNLFEKYHPNHNSPYFNNVGEPHILITVNIDDVLFLERSVTIRAGDYNVDTNKDMISFHHRFVDAFNWRHRFQTLYNIDLHNDYSIPRFILRDFFKMSFLNPAQSGFIQNDRKYRQNKPDNTFFFPVENFWNKEKFFSTLQEVDKKFNLKLQITDDKIYDMFLDNVHFFETKDRAKNIVEAIKNNLDIDITNIDTVEQAYISAWIEKNNDYILIPMCNQFFESTGEIIQWIKQYPQHYKAMNPNLPIYKGKANPFYLHEKQK